jgi:competence protein ComEC
MSNLSNRLQQRPFIRLLFCFCFGIILAECFSPHKKTAFVAIPAILLLLLLFGLKSFKDEISGALILFVFIFLGFFWALHRRYDPKEIPYGIYQAVLDEFPVKKGFSQRAILKLVNSGDKLTAYFDTSGFNPSLKPGCILVFEGKPQLIKNSGNPFEFDYQKYARRNGIGYNIHLNCNEYQFRSNRIKNLRYSALIVRDRLQEKLNGSGIEEKTLKVISAITLGTRDYLDPETTKSFTRTGTLHVLAVSGGNVAVVYAFIYLFFGFLKKRKTSYIFTVLVLTGIWAYTFITGLSPSVLRAAVMFSFISIGTSVKRSPDIYNILASSAFILLFFKPFLLYDVGFQLSYAAVTAIVFLQPLFFRLFYSKYWLIDKLWMLFTISIAAQIGTLPFSLWYFHQFPIYFWLSNLIVVPLVSVFLYLTFFVIFINPFFPLVGFYIMQLLSVVGGWMLKFLQFVEYLPHAVIENIYFSADQLFFCTLFIALSAAYLIYKKSIYIFASLSSLAALLLLTTIDLWKIQERDEIVIFNSKDRILLAFTKGNKTTWITDKTSLLPERFDYIIKPYEGFRRIKNSQFINFSQTGFYKNEMIAIKNNFINYNGVRIYLQNKEDSCRYNDFKFMDFIFTSNHKRIKSSSQIDLIQLNPPMILKINKASLPGFSQTGEARALQIKIDQKSADKKNFRIRNW